MTGTSASAEEIARFGALAARWWDPEGPMRPLHAMNPVRIGWITDQIARRLPGSPRMRLLDVGCGAGLAAEALARRGFDVLGVDPSAEAIAAARAHAEGQGLRLDYRVDTPEALRAEDARFPVITALEVVEHVRDQSGFVQMLADMLEPGGLVILSTLNRTPRAFLTAKAGAEYVLRWLPAGTHDWRKFVKPSELAAMLRHAGLRVAGTAGLSFAPLAGRWRLSRDVSINYMIAAER